MRTYLRGKITLLFMSLGLLLAFAGIALADQIQVDGDVVATGNNNPVSLGTVDPGQTLTPEDARFILNCNSNEHANPGGTISLNFNSGASSAAVTSATNATITVPGTWPVDTTGSCSGVANVNSTNSDVAITAPKAPGLQSVTAVYDIVAPTDAQNETGIQGTSTRSVTYNMTVRNLSPSISSIGGASPVTEGDQGTYTINASDPNETTLSYSLIVVSGDATVVSGGSTSTPVVKFNSPGDVVLRATVDDGVNPEATLERTIAVASANAAPNNPGAPTLDADSVTPNNTGGFKLNWTAASDPDSGDTVTYTLEKKATNVATWTEVANNLNATTYTFTNEPESTWSYRVKAVDNHGASSGYATANNLVKVDKSAPSTPTTVTTTPASPFFGDWFKNSVKVDFSGSTDPNLTDTSDGSGVKSYSTFTYSTSGTHDYSGKAKDHAGNESLTAKTGSVKVDATDPEVNITSCPTTDVIQNSTKNIAVLASDAHSGLATDPSDATVELNTGTIGEKTVSFKAVDNVGHEKTNSCTYNVIFDWSGFFQPIDNKNPDTGNYIPNKAKAGSVIPVKFSLGGDQGLNIFYTADPQKVYPTVVGATGCATGTADLIEEYAPANASGLKYDPLANQYIYNWKTQSNYVGKCLMLNVKLADGETHSALFSFVK